ncbi:unnamed protein product [Linum tenue]|uniref:Cytochrome P450 n=1 Tax=Linum tenue TaxID=586396 RepID=A0AAV0QND8_9ROSI|nr:unnamed protein product [Linum tenue]
MEPIILSSNGSSTIHYLSVPFGALFFSILYYTFSTRRSRPSAKCLVAKLPPGSMGLPIIGETLQFFVPYTSDDISPFISKRVQRHGPVFKTKLIGKPMIVSTDVDVNRLVLNQEREGREEMLFKPWYSDSFNEIMGNDSLLALEGSAHKYMRNLVLEGFGPERLKSLLADMERHTVRHLHSWSSKPSIDLKEAASTMIHSFTVEKVFSMSTDDNEEPLVREFKRCYDDFLHGLISFPIYIPGTSYWKCMKGRKGALNIIKTLMDQRRESPHEEFEERDYLDFMIAEMKKDGSPLTEKVAIDLLFLLPFATFESTSSTIVTAFHYLSKHPAALQELTREHEAILRGRERSESGGISWKEYKSMTFTHMVINETLRLTNIVPGIFRKAVKDVEVNGYLIPAGWTVMVYPASVHLNPKVYGDPLRFNPWRWKGQQLHSGSQNFMAFGGGVRLCAGADFVKVQLAIIFHHLVTKYRWDVIKGKEAVRYPGLIFPEGFHINISEKNVEPAQK